MVDEVHTVLLLTSMRQSYKQGTKILIKQYVLLIMIYHAKVAI